MNTNKKACPFIQFLIEFYLAQEIEAAEEKLRVELERLQYAIAERDNGASSPATIEKKELQDDGKPSDLSSSHEMSALEEKQLQSIKVELVRFRNHAHHHMKMLN